MHLRRSSIKDPTKQIADIMYRDAKRINACKDVNHMLEILTETNTKISMLLKGLRGEVN